MASILGPGIAGGIQGFLQGTEDKRRRTAEDLLAQHDAKRRAALEQEWLNAPEDRRRQIEEDILRGKTLELNYDMAAKKFADLSAPPPAAAPNTGMFSGGMFGQPDMSALAPMNPTAIAPGSGMLVPHSDQASALYTPGPTAPPVVANPKDLSTELDAKWRLVSTAFDKVPPGDNATYNAVLKNTKPLRLRMAEIQKQLGGEVLNNVFAPPFKPLTPGQVADVEGKQARAAIAQAKAGMGGGVAAPAPRGGSGGGGGRKTSGGTSREKPLTPAQRESRLSSIRSQKLRVMHDIDALIRPKDGNAKPLNDYEQQRLTMLRSQLDDLAVQKKRVLPTGGSPEPVKAAPRSTGSRKKLTVKGALDIAKRNNYTPEQTRRGLIAAFGHDFPVARRAAGVGD